MKAEDYLTENGVFAENEKILMRRVSNDDELQYIDLKIEISNIKKAFDDPFFRKTYWDDVMRSEDLVLTLIDKASGDFFGVAVLKNLNDAMPEVGIDLVKKYRKQGLGFSVVSLLLEQAKKCSGKDRYCVRIYSDNIASKKLFEKFGIKEVRREESEFIVAMRSFEKTLGVEYIEKIRNENRELFEKEENRKIVTYEFTV